MKETIFFVEDDKSIHELIKATLEMNGYIVEGFSNPLEFLEALKKTIPDLLILDLMLPHMSGYDLISHLRNNERYSKIPFIILSALSDELDIVLGLEYGAIDYITKPFGILEFASRIKSCLLKCKPAVEHKDVVKVRDLVIDLNKHECTVKGIPLRLTAKEFKLIYILAENSPKVITREELLSEIWGYDSETKTRTLDMHIKTIRDKISQITTDDSYVTTIRAIGFVMN